MIDAGQPLPQRYRTLLFAQPREAGLVWPGKTHKVTNIVLPFQSIEQIDEPRAGTPAGVGSCSVGHRAPYRGITTAFPLLSIWIVARKEQRSNLRLINVDSRWVSFSSSNT